MERPAGIFVRETPEELEKAKKELLHEDGTVHLEGGWPLKKPTGRSMDQLSTFSAPQKAEELSTSPSTTASLSAYKAVAPSSPAQDDSGGSYTLAIILIILALLPAILLIRRRSSPRHD